MTRSLTELWKPLNFAQHLSHPLFYATPCPPSSASSSLIALASQPHCHTALFRRLLLSATRLQRPAPARALLATMASMPMDGAMPMNGSMPMNTTGGHTDHGAHGAHGNAVVDHMMSPYLFTGTTDFFVLFREANVQSTGGFVRALVASFLFATLATVMYETLGIHERKFGVSSRFVLRLVAALMHAFRQLLHYVAMLIVMTMNVWLILAVVLGHGAGFLVYSYALAPRLTRDGVEGKPALDSNGCQC